MPENVLWLPGHEAIKVRQVKVAARDKNNVLRKIRRNYSFRYLEQILITTNLYSKIGKEFCICLHTCWPLNRRSSQIKELNFPTRLLYQLGEIALAGKVIEHGTFFDGRDEIFNKLKLPEGHVILISYFDRMNVFGVEDGEFQSVLMVHYFDSQGVVLNAQSALRIANKKRKSSWAAVAHMPEFREQSIYSCSGR